MPRVVFLSQKNYFLIYQISFLIIIVVGIRKYAYASTHQNWFRCKKYGFVAKSAKTFTIRKFEYSH